MSAASSGQLREFILPDGMRCMVPNGADLLTPFVLGEQGDWFEDEIRFVRNLLKPGATVIDIGANYGTYTLAMAKAVGPTGRVVAFEPATLPSDCLRRSIALNGLAHVDLRVQGLSDSVGPAALRISANPELNALEREGSADADSDSEEIDLTTLDAAFAGEPRAISFIKMDAEGEEERILAGAPTFFRQQDPLVMFELKHGATVNEGLCESFMRRGFLIYRLVPALHALVPIPIGEPLDGFLLNAFAVRPSMEGELQASGHLVPLQTRLPDAIASLKVSEAVEAAARISFFAGESLDWSPKATIPGWDDHRRAVALAWTARDAARSPIERLACLRQALNAARKGLRGGVTGSRLFTLAHIAFGLGFRAEAVAAIQRIVQMVMEGQQLDKTFQEPYLIPLAEHESVHVGTLAERLALVALESYAWKSGFSAYFMGPQAIPLYERIAGMSGCAERSQRALRLLRDQQLARTSGMIV